MEEIFSFVAVVIGRQRITIPVEIRRLLNIERGDTVHCTVKLVKKKDKTGGE